MSILYSTLPQLSQVPRLNSPLQSEDHDASHTSTAVSVVAAHIRSFYRLIPIVMILIILGGAGVATIVVSLIQIRACPMLYNAFRWIGIFGLLEFIMCGIFVIIVVSRATCCYHRSFLLCGILKAIVPFTFSFLMMGTILINHTGVDFGNPRDTDSMKIETCKKLLEKISLVITTGSSVVILVFCLYIVIDRCKTNCQRKVLTNNNFSSTV